MTKSQMDTYPRHPWLAAVLGLLAPSGLLYTSNLLSVLGFLLSIGQASLWTANDTLQIFQMAILASAAYLWATRRPDLSRYPMLARFDAPSWPKAIGLALLYLIFSRTVLTSVSTSGLPMVPTVMPGEKVHVNLLPFGKAQLERGTVVLYKHPERKQKAISRVVALPGDTVELKGALLYVNGEATDNPERISSLKNANCFDAKLDFNNQVDMSGTKALRIPEGTVYLLADNRSQPFEDSRIFGSLPIDKVVGIVRLNSKGSSPLKHADCKSPDSFR